MQTIKTISIPQPYAWATIFSRRWIHSMHSEISFRGRLAIHAGHSVDNLITRLDDGTPVPTILNFGYIIGSVKVVNCVTPDHPLVFGSHWAIGPWCLVLSDPKPLRVPVKSRGKPGLYEVDLQRIEEAQNPPRPPETNKPHSLFDDLYA